MNCKPGEMAFVVSDPYPENIGRLVTILRAAGSEWWMEPGFNWVVKPANQALIGHWDQRAGRVVGSRWVSCECAFLDCCLRPIRPDGITTEEVTHLYSPSPVKEVA